MSKILPRAAFLKLFATSPQGAFLMPSVERALAELGWQTKQTFSRDDAQRLTVKLAELGEADLRASTDERARAMGEKLGPVMDEIRGLQQGR